MDKHEVIEVKLGEIQESQVPTIIHQQFGQLQRLKENVESAKSKAKTAQSSATSAKKKSAGVGKKKVAIEYLQDAAVDLADAQISSAEAQEISFEYQQKLGEITKYLFGLGVTNIAVNRSVVRELEMRLKGASEEEIDEFARQELMGVVRQLKAQEDIMKKQSELSQIVYEHDVRLDELETEGDGYEQRLTTHEKHERHQDELLEKQAEKDIEHNRLLSESMERDKFQDAELERQAEKDLEHDRMLSESMECDKFQDAELERQAERDLEHDKQLNDLLQENLKQNDIIAELEKLCVVLDEQILDSNQKTNRIREELLNTLKHKSNKGIAIAALIISLVAFATVIAQFFL